MTKLTKLIYGLMLLPLILLFGSCASIQGSRIHLGKNEEPDSYTELSRQLLVSAKQFNDQIYTSHDRQLRLKALKSYKAKLSPQLTKSFQTLLSKYTESKTLAFKTNGPSSRFDKADYDPVLQRRWQPDAQVLSREYPDNPNEQWVIVNDLLLDAKIYTGHQAETKLIFRKVNELWLLDDVISRFRYNYDDSVWSMPVSTKKKMAQEIKIYQQDLAR